MKTQPAPASCLARVQEARATIRFFKAVGDGTMHNRTVTFTRNGDGTLTLRGADFHPEGVFARIPFPQTVAFIDRGGQRLTLTLDFDRREFTHATTSTLEADQHQERTRQLSGAVNARLVEEALGGLF